MDGLPTMSTQTFIGISVDITGNILISLALNLQKVAHKRVETLKKAGKKRTRHSDSNGYNDLSESRASEGPSLDERDEDRELLDVRRTQVDVFSDSSSEIQPLNALLESEYTLRHYGTDASPRRSIVRKPSTIKLSIASLFLPTRFLSKKTLSGRCNPDANTPEGALNGLPSTNKGLNVQSEPDDQNSKEGNESDYLKSRLWLTTNKIFRFDQRLIISY